MPTRLHRWRRTAAASVALFLAALTLLAGRVRAGDDPALGSARSSSTASATQTGTSSPAEPGTAAASEGSDTSSSADMPTTGAS